MRVPLNWLRDYVDWPWETPELAERLTMSGVKVELLHRFGDGLNGVIAAAVLEVSPHPDPEAGLWVVDLDTGSGRARVVAGIANMKPRDVVPYAPPGSTLPGQWPISAANLRGVTSEGMILSLSELLLGEKPREGEGVLILGPGPGGLPGREGSSRGEIAPGTNLSQAMGLPETVLELDLTPNYAAHCQSVIGVAREVAALTGVGPSGVRRPGAGAGASPERPETAGKPASGAATVTIEAPDLCSRYVARVIRGIRVGPSPWLVQVRILAAGMRPINNIVDATNYVMLESGQPLHAFDLARVEGGHIIVRRARPGETIVTLDGEHRELPDGALVITDPTGPLAVAGVMGGERSEVTAATADILLESACFDARAVRRASSRLGLASEASGRFDKGADPLGVDPASRRAAHLIADLAGGVVASGEVDVKARSFAPVSVRLRTARVGGLLGTASAAGGSEAGEMAGGSEAGEIAGDSEAAEIAGYLQRLGFACRPDTGARGVLAVTVPSWRTDVNGEADLIEEFARLYGYSRIPAALPRGATTVGSRPRGRRLADRARQVMTSLGFSETVSSSLVDPLADGRLSPPAAGSLVLANPFGENRSAMRAGLLGGLVDAAAHNQSHGEPDLRLFEIGTVYHPRPGALSPANLPEERPCLAAVGTGRTADETWPSIGVEVDFFYIKGVVETALRQLGVSGWRFLPGSDGRFHPGRQARVLAGGAGQGVELGVIGELHPRVLRDREVEGRVTAIELDFGAVVAASAAEVRAEPLPKFPVVTRDVAVILGEEVEAGRIEEVIRRSAGSLCVGVRLFDLYRGHPVPEKARSTAWRIVYRAPDRSLTDAEVDDLHGRVREALRAELGAVLR